MTAPSTPKAPRKKPKSNTPAKPVVPRKEATLHPRNRHQGRYDFQALIKTTPELAQFVIINPYGKESIDFASPDAVRVFNRALLKAFYGINHWDIPADYLCPPVPGRADYVHFLADLLASVNEGVIPRGAPVKVLDIGMGANCVYPLIGYSEYRWNFLGSEVDPTAVAAAKAIVQSNGLNKAIQLRQQTNPKQILLGLLEPGERFDLTMCNPPFHASMDEATKGSERKWRALGKADPKRKLPVLNFGGQSAELWCEGGEARFVTQLIAESAHFQHKVLWFSTLVSKASNLPAIQTALKKAGVLESQVVEMSQGQKQSRFVAWTFQTPSEQQVWRQRWARKD
ncbi:MULTISPECIES: 23S rRNA (adenine(1618)-N(6))-methyltransferase RlmF [unclassified Pseudomonas]|uniref:23S rRNA (adenine(1618)-N(6))-methyltransferase RlmF n=1 Tax=unclassified Pseudomonas TaxID=196821 RepID=UPI000B400F59|nr:MULTISPECIES: 23S rRNA (adenine(1618)-N(6))-methyltransferase RlmF [unclassified Pseudomonas]MBT1267592.1 23S rRNA (adenine(1618)-N(6))-methyltransferase RlmF [Pseudomonas sp. VS38]NVZ41134.1 23S rRNA (adenine(1618)-N(6))-methyltransferase RlmF [Pseudomonas sp. 21615526]NWB23028.1 23S rRNA (adenine(1618)-N(6))-methyltransferase RlmF [Pseudomonas sp. D4002]NWB68767.1 23S rRNA (adenine(1618)-N(6))-methyltransferase RlmF [Pseudomonas sp. I8001]NWC01001.1 23S rRNA (adenine(1618)-N(6))-methyltra|eukprot:gene22952-35179_t